MAEMTREEVLAIKALADRATKEPWYEDDCGMMVWAVDPYGHGDMRIADVRGWGHLTGSGSCGFDQKKGGEIQDANMNLIARARTAVPALCDEALRLMQENEELRWINDASGFEYQKLQAENARLQAELEAAKRDLANTACCRTCRSWFKNGGDCAPIKPKGMPDCTANEDNPHEWEWRGVAENGGESK